MQTDDDYDFIIVIEKILWYIKFFFLIFEYSLMVAIAAQLFALYFLSLTGTPVPSDEIQRRSK